jgi:hypothetical protein
MIKLYYDKNLRIEAKKYELFPLLEKLEEKDSVLSEYYQIADSLEESDIGIVPLNVQFLYMNHKKNEVLQFFDNCKNHGKKTLIFSGGDFGYSIDAANIYSVRLGGFNTVLNNQTFMMPPFIHDPYEVLNREFSTISKNDKPTIGFVGHANGSIIKLVKEYLLFVKGNLNRLKGKDLTDSQTFYPSGLKRYKYLNNLSGNASLECDFILRGQYRAGIRTSEEKETTTSEFYNNIRNNMYTFCLRGTGNFSVRFYETLALGRIPVLIDTDCRLPFADTINWNDHCVIIPESESDSIAERIINFHTEHSEERLISIQNENRNIWKNYLSKTSFFIALTKELENLIQTE